MAEDRAHPHEVRDFNAAFAVGIVLNVGFVAVETVYGWKRASILAAFINAILLLVAMGSLAWEAAHRLRDTPSIIRRS